MKHADNILETVAFNSVFVGDALSFSDTAVTFVDAKLPCISSIRVSAVADVFSLEKTGSDPLRMIIVDELMLDDLAKALPQLRATFPATCIALAYRQPEAARKFLGELQLNPSWGKVGFLPMNTNLDCWLSIVRLLASGECYVPVELFATPQPTQPVEAPPLANDADQPAKDIHLTERELEVLASAASGKQNKIIADDLKLSQHTVKLHMHHIIAKLGVNNRTEAANWFHRRKMRV